MPRTKHTPIRTCVACRQTDEKRDLLRLVRLAEGIVEFDPKGKAAGRGAYVCADLTCITQSRKQKRLERSLKVPNIAETVFETLISHIQVLQIPKEEGGLTH